MADESILTYKKPGFPRYTNNESAFQTVIEYVGPYDDLAAAMPLLNSSWGGYPGIVAGSSLNVSENSDYAELTITVEYKYDSGDFGFSGDKRETSYEVEWVMFQRDLLEHPDFLIGGGGQYALSGDDVDDIEYWKNEPNKTLKNAYMFDNDGTKNLSNNAQQFCKFLKIGIDSYEDYAPVVRKTTNYVNGLPPDSTAGSKNAPPSFSGKPDGYEWRKTADRSVRAGGQTRWERSEEWTGAKVIFTDKDKVYPPNV